MVVSGFRISGVNGNWSPQFDELSKHTVSRAKRRCGRFRQPRSRISSRTLHGRKSWRRNTFPFTKQPFLDPNLLCRTEHRDQVPQSSRHRQSLGVVSSTGMISSQLTPWSRNTVSSAIRSGASHQQKRLPSARLYHVLIHMALRSCARSLQLASIRSLDTAGSW